MTVLAAATVSSGAAGLPLPTGGMTILRGDTVTVSGSHSDACVFDYETLAVGEDPTTGAVVATYSQTYSDRCQGTHRFLSGSGEVTSWWVDASLSDASVTASIPVVDQYDGHAEVVEVDLEVLATSDVILTDRRYTQRTSPGARTVERTRMTSRYAVATGVPAALTQGSIAHVLEGSLHVGALVDAGAANLAMQERSGAKGNVLSVTGYFVDPCIVGWQSVQATTLTVDHRQAVTYARDSGNLCTGEWEAATGTAVPDVFKVTGLVASGRLVATVPLTNYYTNEPAGSVDLDLVLAGAGEAQTTEIRQMTHDADGSLAVERTRYTERMVTVSGTPAHLSDGTLRRIHDGWLLVMHD